MKHQKLDKASRKQSMIGDISVENWYSNESFTEMANFIFKDRHSVALHF